MFGCSGGNGLCCVVVVDVDSTLRSDGTSAGSAHSSDRDSLVPRLRSDGITAGSAHSSAAPLDSHSSDCDMLTPRLRFTGRTAGSFHRSELLLLLLNELPPTGFLLT